MRAPGAASRRLRVVAQVAPTDERVLGDRRQHLRTLEVAPQVTEHVSAVGDEPGVEAAPYSPGDGVAFATPAAAQPPAQLTRPAAGGPVTIAIARLYAVLVAWPGRSARIIK